MTKNNPQISNAFGKNLQKMFLTIGGALKYKDKYLLNFPIDNNFLKW